MSNALSCSEDISARARRIVSMVERGGDPPRAAAAEGPLDDVEIAGAARRRAPVVTNGVTSGSRLSGSSAWKAS